MNGNEGKDNVTEDIWVLETLFYALTNRNVWKSVGEGHVTVEHDNANHVNVGQYVSAERTSEPWSSASSTAHRPWHPWSATTTFST